MIGDEVTHHCVHQLRQLRQDAKELNANLFPERLFLLAYSHMAFTALAIFLIVVSIFIFSLCSPGVQDWPPRTVQHHTQECAHCR